MEVTPDLLRKYYQGHCTEEEIEAVKAWLRSGTLPAGLPEGDNDGPVTEALWRELETELLPEASGRGLFVRYRLAAAVAVLLLAAFGYFRYESAHSPARPGRPAAAAPPLRTLGAPNGERRLFHLPDGTEVFLNSGSEIRFPARFTDSVRQVWLRGEARFKVTSNPSRPFLVHTASTLTRVLGTTFTLRSYPETPVVSLVVEEGKVLFSGKNGKGNGLTLTAGLRGFTTPSGAIRKEKVYLPGYNAWTRRQLVFADEPLSEIAHTLERWYNIRVIIKSAAVGSRKCTGSFTDPPLQALVNSLSYSLNFRYHLKQNTLTIY